MTKIYIPFWKEFEEQMTVGVPRWKTATTRSKRYGKAGDYFVIFGCKFELTGVERKSLGMIRKYHYKEEGYNTPDGFLDIWKRLYPDREFNPTDRKYIHFFKLVEKDVTEPPRYY